MQLLRSEPRLCSSTGGAETLHGILQNEVKRRRRNQFRQRRRRQHTTLNFISVFVLLLLFVEAVQGYQSTTTPRRYKQWFPRPNYFLERPRYQVEQRYDQQVTIARTVQSIAELTPVQEALYELAKDRNYTISSKEIFGASFATIVVLGLAASTSAGDASPDLPELAVKTAENVIDAAGPGNAADIVSVLLAESIAGVVGAIASLLLNFCLQSQNNKRKQRNQNQNGDVGAMQPIDAKPLVGEAVASSEYFIALSVSYPLLRATGISAFAATLSSTILSTIPYEIVKSNVAQQSFLQKEDELLDQLLEEKNRKEKEKQDKSLFFGIFKSTFSFPDQRVDPASLVTIEKPKFDVVEFFTDVTRWLEYDVLKSDFQGRLTWGTGASMVTIDPSICSAIFGFLAAASSQFYADCLYGIFKFGPQSKRDKLKSRTIGEWISTYASGCVTSAALFGVYDFAQRPVGRWVQGTLAGGVDGCFGSDDFDLCLQTYIDTNSPGPSPEAQFRALATNLAMVGERLQDIYADAGSPEEVGAQFNAIVASAAVSAYSLFTHYLPILTAPVDGYQF